MKKTRLIIALALLFGMATLAEAQIVVTSTSATTIKPKSGREQGFVIRPEINIGGDNYIPGWLMDFNVSLAYHFNPNIAIGGGIGLNNILSHTNSYYTRSTLSSIPIFANLRVYFSDRKLSPFIDLKLGPNIPISKGISKYLSDGETNYRYSFNGLRLNCTAGIEYNSFDFGLLLGIFGTTREHYWDGDYHDLTRSTNYVVMLNFAYNIPLNKH